MALTNNGRPTNTTKYWNTQQTDTGTGRGNIGASAGIGARGVGANIGIGSKAYTGSIPGVAGLGQLLTQTPKTPTARNSSPNRRGGYGDNNYNALWEYFRNMNEQGRQDAINAILARLNTNIDMYNGQLGDVNDEYQKLINQSEVNRYRSKHSVREALANRGQLDSGLGRQEQLNLDISYGNQLNNILMERERQRNEIRNKISELRANAEEEKANVNNQYNEQLLKWQSANAK